MENDPAANDNKNNRGNGAHNPQFVLYASVTGILGGAERSLLDIIDTLDRESYTPEAVLLDHGPLADELRERNVPVHFIERGKSNELTRGGRISFFKKIGAALSALRIGFQLGRLAKRRNAKIIHTNGIKLHYISTVAKFLTGARIVWHLRDIVRESFEGKLFRTLGRFVPARIIANSQASAKAMGLPQKTDVVYNGIDLDYFSAADAKDLRARWGAEEDDVIILLAGMLCPLKGQHLLLDAVAKILPDVPRARIVFAGSASYTTGDPGFEGYAAGLRTRAEALAIDDRVVWAGLLPDPRGAYAACDMLVSCSTKPESFGRSLAEAMAAGKPCIAFNEGGPAEIIADGKTGILVEPQNTDALAEAIRNLCKNKAIRMEMGKIGQSRAHDLYDRCRLGRECAHSYDIILDRTT